MAIAYCYLFRAKIRVYMPIASFGFSILMRSGSISGPSLSSQSTSELPIQNAPGQALLQYTTVGLELNEATIQAEGISDIAGIGLNGAVVRLENTENGDVIPAVKTG